MIARRRRLSLIREIEPLESRQLLRAGGADTVYLWNAVALQAIRVDKTAPPLAARDLAIVQVAVDDAVTTVSRKLTARTPGYDVALDAAVVAAADRALDALFPAGASSFEGLMARSLAALPAGPPRSFGVAVGRLAAGSVLADRRNDGALATVAYTPGTAPGQWVPTPPGFAKALLPQWPEVTPFALRSVSQFRPGPPPALTSRAYAEALNQVEQLGRSDSKVRTADQTAIAQFWADGAGTATPPGHWNEIAVQVSSSRGLDTVRAAHVLAMLDVALADAGIACWDTKFTYNVWRPVTAIRAANVDGNPRTTADPTWTPLLVTPPFPSYDSGHSTFSAAAATVLSAVFGPQTRFAIGSDARPGEVRSFQSFAQAAAEAGISRIYGGIHFSFDNTAGLALGQKVGAFDLRHYAPKVVF
jgi:membrane-associated phospholipid phosphatase